MEAKTNWLRTILAYIAGIMYIFAKLSFVIDLILMGIVEVLNFIFYIRPADIGVVSKKNKTISQSPNLKSIKGYKKIDYHKERNKVRESVTKDFKKLILGSLKIYPVVFIYTNNFIYKYVLLKLQEGKFIKVKRFKGYKAPQITEKARIMNRRAIIRCFWDYEAFKKLFQMEEIYKYRLEKVVTL